MRITVYACSLPWPLRHPTEDWEHLASLASARIRLGELYERVLENLQQGKPEIKALALNALDIKVYAQGTNEVEIQGAIPIELASPTIAQTSA